MLELTQATSPEDIAAAKELMLEYRASLGVDLCFQGFDAEVRALPGDYAPPRGRLLLARHDGALVGCVGLRPIAPPRCEMKRLFVRPEARGVGAGRALVARVIEEARSAGYEEMVLDTLPSMTAAQALYRHFDFDEIAPYCANPIEGARFLGRRLDRG